MTSLLLPVLDEPRYSQLIGRPLDNTAEKDYQDCHWRYLASMVWHRRKDGPPSPPLGFGSGLHAVMEAHYKYVPPPALQPGALELRNPLAARALRDQIIQDMAEQVEIYAETQWEDHQVPDDHRTFQRLMLDYKSYLKKYPLPWEGDDKTVGWPQAPMVEKAVELAVPGLRHPYTGKIDRVFKMQGQYYVDDHKHSSRVINFNEYTLSNQMMGYAVLGQLLTGQPIAGVRINGFIVHKGETLFERRIIPFSQKRLEGWVQDTDAWMARIESSMRALHVAEQTLGAAFRGDEEDVLSAFPRNHNSCVHRYGMCGYAGICSLDPEIRMQSLAEDFKVVPWNPLEAKVVDDA
jgi:hypothetical protein